MISAPLPLVPIRAIREASVKTFSCQRVAYTVNKISLGRSVQAVSVASGNALASRQNFLGVLYVSPVHPLTHGLPPPSRRYPAQKVTLLLRASPNQNHRNRPPKNL